MAYEPNTWIDRQGQGLNKFKDQNNNQYTFTPDPDFVSQTGTPFSAAWMNHIEQGIYQNSLGGFAIANLGDLQRSETSAQIIDSVGSDYNAYIAVGSTTDGGSCMCMTIPKVLILDFNSSSPIQFQMADEANYISWRMYSDGTNIFAYFRNASSSGYLKYIYGVRLG